MGTSAPVAAQKPCRRPASFTIRASELTKENIPPNQGCPICSRGIKYNHKDVLFLTQFLDTKGWILKRQVTKVCAGQHRKLQKAIHQARQLGLIPRVID